jgi:hypothetical protein
MRWCVALALISTFLSTNALAADKGGKNKKKDGKEDKSAATMDTGNDPARTEKSDQGPYAPKGATGALAEKRKEEEEEEDVIKARPRDKADVFADFILGFGQAPKPGPAGFNGNRLTKSTSLAFVLGGSVDLSRTFSLGLRLPWTYASSALGPTTTSVTAFGAPEILGEYRHYLSDITSLPVLFGLGVPVAQGDPNPSGKAALGDTNQYDTNLIADASSGYRDGELYASKRLPVLLGIGIRHERRALVLSAATKFAFGLRMGGSFDDFHDSTTQGTYYTSNALSLRNVTVLSGTYDIVPKFWGGADLWMTTLMIPEVGYKSPATPPSPFQFVLEPRVGLKLGKIRPSAGVLLPLGGRLADPGMFGVHLRLDVVF